MTRLLTTGTPSMPLMLDPNGTTTVPTLQKTTCRFHTRYAPGTSALGRFFHNTVGFRSANAGCGGVVPTGTGAGLAAVAGAGLAAAAGAGLATGAAAGVGLAVAAGLRSLALRRQVPRREEGRAGETLDRIL